jgi:hypothetical protein
MKIEIIKIDSGKFCMQHSCKKESKYVTPKGRIKKGTTAAKIIHTVHSKYGHKESHFYYCRSCIDQLLLDCRAKLDSKLWIFS